MIIPVYEIVFYVFATLLVFASLAVVLSSHPVRAVLCLIFSFFATSVLWMLLQAEFLSLVLIFVYVGAVMTLFLFVVMMMHIDLSIVKERFIRHVPWALIVMLIFSGGLIWLIHHASFGAATGMTQPYSANDSNTQALGVLLFSHYWYPFEIAGLILLVAIVSAISLAFYGRKPGTHAQHVPDQIRTKKSDRLRIIRSKEWGK